MPVVPAAAGDDPVPWQDTAACATGAFTGHTVYPADFLGPYLELTGWAQRCGDEKQDEEPPAARFGFAYFSAQDKIPGAVGLLHERRLRSYGPGFDPTAFVGRFDMAGTGSKRQGSPICLMLDRTTRVACVNVRVMLIGTMPSFEVTPLAIDDASVVGLVTVQPRGGGEPFPNCGTCL
jgi:hypothetical protein